FSVVKTASALGFIGAQTEDDEGAFSDVYWDELTNIKPEILNFGASQLVGGAWLITGRVNDEAPGGLTVTLRSGESTLDGRSLTAASDGTFSTVFTPPRKFQGCSIAARLTDGWGATSDAVYTIIFP